MRNASHRAWTPTAEYGAYYLERIDGLFFEPGKPFRKTMRRIIKLQDAGSVSRFSTMDFQFDPLNERICVNRLTVKDESGHLISEGRTDDYYVTDKRPNEPATYDKMLHIPIAGLKAGYVIELTVTIGDQAAATTMQFTECPLALDIPIRHNLAFIQGNIDRVKYEVQGKSERHDHAGLVYWETFDQPAYAFETQQPAIRTFLPWLLIGDASAQWDTLARTYLNDIKGCLESDEAIDNLPGI